MRTTDHHRLSLLGAADERDNSYLLQVWGGAADAAAGAETGAVARMHSALIAVVAHLLARLGGQALDEAQVRACASTLIAWPAHEVQGNGQVVA